MMLRSLFFDCSPKSAVSLSYPAEWLLDIFNNGNKSAGYRPQLYVWEPHPIPFLLQDICGIPKGFAIVLVLLAVEICLGVKICHGL